MQYIKKIFNGRIGRKNYFLGLLFFIILFYIATFISLFLASLTGALNDTGGIIFPIIEVCLLLVYIVFVFSLHVRRLHDMGNSGFWILLGPIAVFMCLFIKGDKAGNKYGENLQKGMKFFKVIFKPE